MTTIRLTNTKTRRKEVFEPIDRDNVRMYVCGPTVYDRAHLGNARPVVVFDTLYRLLRHVYGPDHVTYVRNFTDVDDKINDAALARKQAGDPRSLEELIHERTEETIRWYHEDMDALGALRPTQEPRATEWIGAMTAMIEDLIAKGHAYEAAGHVLFRVRSYKDYGALSGRSVDDMISGARVEVAPFKEDPLDFVLWKPSDATLPGWESPWGRGRPGWHIECSAMARELLGTSFDIHGGGLDLQFPHHENEIAQSCCANPDASFARYWVHNEMVLVEGEKMSKSLGNFLTVKDLLRAWLGKDRFLFGYRRHSQHIGARDFARPFSRHAVRLALLMTHYRDKLDWTFERAIEADRTYQRLRISLIGKNIDYRTYRSALPAQLIEILADDLNTPDAVRFLTDLASKVRKDIIPAEALLASMEFLGLIEDASVKRRAIQSAMSTLVNAIGDLEALGIAPESIFDDLNEASSLDYRRLMSRMMLRVAHSSRRSTKVERALEKLEETADPSVSVQDRSRIFRRASPRLIWEMIEKRNNAKKDKDFDTADQVRMDLARLGLEITDTSDGIRWRILR